MEEKRSPPEANSTTRCILVSVAMTSRMLERRWLEGDKRKKRREDGRGWKEMAGREKRRSARVSVSGVWRNELYASLEKKWVYIYLVRSDQSPNRNRPN